MRSARVLNAQIAQRVDRKRLALLRVVPHQIHQQGQARIVLALVEILDDLRLFVVHSV